MKAFILPLFACVMLASGASVAAESPVTNASGKGEQATISPFRHTLPDLYDFNQIPVEQMGTVLPARPFTMVRAPWPSGYLLKAQSCRFIIMSMSRLPGLLLARSKYFLKANGLS